LRRSNPESFRGEILDCFAALAMTEDGYWCRSFNLQFDSQARLRVLAASSPELCCPRHTLLEQRAQGRPGAGRHPRSAARNAHAEKTAQQHTGVAEHTAFPARWSDGLCRALPGADASFWPPSRLRKSPAAAPVGTGPHPQGLTVANDGQDHTVLPYAFSAVRPTRLAKELTRLGSIHCPALLSASATTLPASTATRSAARDDVRPPLFAGSGWATHTTKPNFGKVEYFDGSRLTQPLLCRIAADARDWGHRQTSPWHEHVANRTGRAPVIASRIRTNGRNSV